MLLHPALSHASPWHIVHMVSVVDILRRVVHLASMLAILAAMVVIWWVCAAVVGWVAAVAVLAAAAAHQPTDQPTDQAAHSPASVAVVIARSVARSVARSKAGSRSEAAAVVVIIVITIVLCAGCLLYRLYCLLSQQPPARWLGWGSTFGGWVACCLGGVATDGCPVCCSGHCSAGSSRAAGFRSWKGRVAGAG